MLAGDARTFRVFLDPNQYQKDMQGTVTGQEVGRQMSHTVDV